MRKRSRKSLILSGAATAIATTASLAFRPDRALRVVTGVIQRGLERLDHLVADVIATLGSYTR